MTSNPYDLVIEGRYTEAIRGYTDILEVEADGPNYFNRGLAFLSSGDCGRAMSDFEAAERAGGGTSSYRRFMAVVHWVEGRFEEASDLWQQILLALENGEISYTDAAGGVGIACLLWFAGVRLDRSDYLEIGICELERLATSKRSANWPGPVGAYILGRITEHELRTKCSLPRRDLCVADFYVGVKSLHAGDEKQFTASMKKSSELSSALLEPELYLARFEFERSCD